MFCNIRRSGVLMAVLAIAACARGSESDANTTPGAAASTTSAVAAPAVDATGDTIVVEMWTDPAGNYFKPAKFEAHRGDVVSFVLKSGVHNVHFLADSNPGKSGLPPMSEFLQLPGQTYDVLIAMPEGDYYFQCDPHALLGMVGRIEVEEKDDDDGERGTR